MVFDVRGSSLRRPHRGDEARFHWRRDGRAQPPSRVAQTLAIQRVCGSWFRGARGGAIMRWHVRVAAIDSVGPALLPSAREVRDLWTTSRCPTTCVPLRE